MFQSIRSWKISSLALPLMLVFFCLLTSPVLGQIGQQAQDAAAQSGHVAEPVTQNEVDSVVKLLQLLGGLVVVATAFLLGWVARLIDFRPFRGISVNNLNGWLMLFFGAGFLGLVIFEIMVHSERLYLVVNAASEHGLAIDTLMHITIAITLSVFFIVQAVLFYFAFTYRSRPGSKASFISHNDKLEVIWTLVPSIVLFVLVGYGLVVWSDVHYPDPSIKVKHIEVVAEQFQWRIRYAGEDNELGKTSFQLTSGTNPLAMDSSDAKAADDRIPMKKEIYMLKGQAYKFKIRSKDVLHGFYMPHFRVNMYAVPGMPTQFQFTPIKTTAEMKAIYGPDFEYELACSQLCGSAHYNMKVSIVVVDKPEEMQAWLEQQPRFTALPKAEGETTPAAEVKKEEGQGSAKNSATTLEQANANQAAALKNS